MQIIPKQTEVLYYQRLPTLAQNCVHKNVKIGLKVQVSNIDPIFRGPILSECSVAAGFKCVHSLPSISTLYNKLVKPTPRKKILRIITAETSTARVAIF